VNLKIFSSKGAFLNWLMEDGGTEEDFSLRIRNHLLGFIIWTYFQLEGREVGLFWRFNWGKFLLLGRLFILPRNFGPRIILLTKKEILEFYFNFFKFPFFFYKGGFRNYVPIFQQAG